MKQERSEQATEMATGKHAVKYATRPVGLFFVGELDVKNTSSLVFIKQMIAISVGSLKMKMLKKTRL